MHTPASPQLGLHVIAKPIGPVCNLRCSYCYYLEKESPYARDEQWRMSDETLEQYVRQYMQAQPHNVDHLGRVYTFLRDAGVTFMQFIRCAAPLVE